eukprot:8568915-Pyramimonas_sp.AAC.1
MGPRLGGGGRMHAVALGPSVELPMGPRSAVLGGGTHAGGKPGTSGGDPYGATKHWVGGRMRAVALGPSLEHPMGPRSAVR